MMRQILERARVVAASQELTPMARVRKRGGRTVPYRLQREYGPARAFRCADFRCLSSRFVRQYISIALSHPVCGNFLWHSSKTNTQHDQVGFIYWDAKDGSAYTRQPM